MLRKVLVSVPGPDLRRIDAAARRAGESRSAFVRRAALAAAARGAPRPMDDPRHRATLAALRRLAARMPPMTTDEILAARDRGRR